ncbi:hypothetical protein ACFLT2_10435 [Acidobacteriota bacterium]
MSMINERIFKGLDDDFFGELKGGKLRYILDYERKHRKSLLIEIRKNYLDLYFLGHGVVVKRRKDRYYLSASQAFNPKDILKGINIIENFKSRNWKIFFDEIKEGQFENIMDAILTKIIMHRHGDISEGVSEINHFVDNRAIGRNGILIIDRQVSYPGIGERMDLLGLKRMPSGKFTFAIVELKNKNNTDIGSVFSQITRYIDILIEREAYERFAETYRYVKDQKVKLRLLRKISGDIAPFNEIRKKDIGGIVILDNYNIKSDIKPDGLLGRAIKNWDEVGSEYDLKLYVKTNVLDGAFFLDRNEAGMLLERYKKNN